MSQCVLVSVTQLQDERLSIIDRDNRLLASKLADIVCSKGLVDHRNQYHLRRYGPHDTFFLSFLTHHVMSSLSMSQPPVSCLLSHILTCDMLWWHVCPVCPATSHHVCLSCLSCYIPSCLSCLSCYSTSCLSCLSCYIKSCLSSCYIMLCLHMSCPVTSCLSCSVLCSVQMCHIVSDERNKHKHRLSLSKNNLTNIKIIKILDNLNNACVEFITPADRRSELLWYFLS